MSVREFFGSRKLSYMRGCPMAHCRRLNWVWRDGTAGLAQIVLLSALLVSVGCAHRAQFVPPEQLEGYAHLEEHQGVTVAVKPYSGAPELKHYFSKDLTEYGLLPVNIVIFNDSGERYVFTKSYVELISADGKSTNPMPFITLKEKVEQTVGESRFPLKWFLSKEARVRRSLAREIRDVEFPSTMILPEQRYGGFVYFPCSQDDDLLSGSELRVQLKSFTPRGDLNFLFHLP